MFDRSSTASPMCRPQSTLEGDVTRAGVAFARYDPETGETDPLKILMSTGLFGVKYLLLNAPMDLLDNPSTSGTSTNS